jgi:GNAT superfamily N-acetyltransferase
MDKVQIISSNSSLLAIQCSNLSNEIFGLNYHQFSFFNDPDRIKLLAINDSKLIGFLVAKKIKRYQIEIESIGIDKRWQRNTIGTQLMKRFIDTYCNQKVKIITKAWKSNNIIYVAKLIEKFGLKPIRNMGKLWGDQCNLLFKCKHYNGTCKCECILYSN